MRRLLFLFAVILIIGIVSADTTVELEPVEWGSPGYDSGTTARTFNVLMDTAGNTGDYGAFDHSFQRSHASTSARYIKAERANLIFNITDAVPDDATITAAKLVTVVYLNDNGLGSPKWTLTMSQPTNPLAIADADYNYAKYTNITLSDWYNHPAATGIYYNYTLNANGTEYLQSISNRSKTSVYANLSIRDQWDFLHAFNGTWAAGSTTRNAVYTPAEANTTRHPYLLITYTTEEVPDAPVASFTQSATMLRIPKVLTVTDTSTNSPTSWEWSWGDGTANSTTQNPTHQYQKRGRFTIGLTATNAGGGSSTTSTVRVVGYENAW